MTAVCSAAVDVFQSTPPRGGRRRASSLVAVTWIVSIHAPARGATRDELVAPQRHRCSFNPRPRAGRDARRAVAIDHGHDVSIHAPARGATTRCVRCCAADDGFNPRPRAGGDCSRPYRTCMPIAFQSTPPRGGRRIWRGLHFSIVSIHAPRAGGDASQVLNGSLLVFQSTPPRGGRRSSRGKRAAQACFNPRPRAGGDENGAAFRPCGCFNPRPRAGGDISGSAKRLQSGVSIHAPARGATSSCGTCSNHWCFNPRAPRGGRPAEVVHAIKARGVSIHAPRAGGDSEMEQARRTSWSVAPGAGIETNVPGFVSLRAPRGARGLKHHEP